MKVMRASIGAGLDDVPFSTCRLVQNDRDAVTNRGRGP